MAISFFFGRLHHPLTPLPRNLASTAPTDFCRSHILRFDTFFDLKHPSVILHLIQILRYHLSGYRPESLSTADPMATSDKADVSKPSELYKALGERLKASIQGGVRSWSPISLFGNSSYTPVQDADGQIDNGTAMALELRRKDTTIRRWQCLSAILAVFLITLVVSFPKPPSRYPQPGEGTDNLMKWMKEAEVAKGHDWCGPTTAEAKNRGCAFSKVHNRWTSPRCEADFEPAREAVLKALDGDVPDFVFYRDDNGKPGAEIPEEELNELELLTPAWTTVSHHATHCMYLLLQAAASLNLGTKAERVVHAWEHTGHCASIIMNLTKTAPGWDDIASFGHTQSAVCW